MAFAPACILQTLFQSYFVTAGHPGMGLGLMIVAGCTNAALDYVFIAAMHMGIAGAALATGIGQCIPAVAGVVFFLFTKKELRFTRCGFYPKETAKAAFNGSSEMVTELSTAIITFLFNIILLRLAGEHGVAAITILLYGEFLFTDFILGFAIGISPIIGFQYGDRTDMSSAGCTRSPSCSQQVHPCLWRSWPSFCPALSRRYSRKIRRPMSWP